MADNPSYESNDHALRFKENEERVKPAVQEERTDSPWSYTMKVGRGTIRLELIEYRILSFLSARPYQAFTPVQIAQAVSTEEYPVTKDTLRKHIESLREKLGFYSDYIQTVPYIGYRYKA